VAPVGLARRRPGQGWPGQGETVTVLKVVLTYVLTIYLLLLIGRLIIDMLQSYSRSWTPAGVLAMIAEIIFTVTDPPLRLLRRYIRPVRIGRVGLDLSYTLLFVLIIVLLAVVGRL
jgi:YggT family protein